MNDHIEQKITATPLCPRTRRTSLTQGTSLSRLSVVAITSATLACAAAAGPADADKEPTAVSPTDGGGAFIDGSDVFATDGATVNDAGATEDTGRVDASLGNETGVAFDAAAPFDAGPPVPVLAVQMGWSSTCAILQSGAVKCSGLMGTVGDGTGFMRLTPVPVVGLTSGVTQLALGERHSCAIQNGGAKCWGRGGSLGDATNTERLAPVSVTNLTSSVTSIAVGGFTSCAITTGGAAKCWGGGLSGQLGTGKIVNELVPADVTGIANGATAIAVGSQHACAVVSGGVSCWGSNEHGQLGTASTGTCVGPKPCSLTPLAIAGLTGVKGVTAGDDHTCALLAAGTIKCWGDNAYGQLGDGTKTLRGQPTDVVGISGATAVAAGGRHTCAVTGGSVKCWGNNFWGAVGDGTAGTGTERVSPTQVQTLSSNVTSIGVGSGALGACAVGPNQYPYCWGRVGVNPYTIVPSLFGPL